MNNTYIAVGLSVLVIIIIFYFYFFRGGGGEKLTKWNVESVTAVPIIEGRTPISLDIKRFSLVTPEREYTFIKDGEYIADVEYNTDSSVVERFSYSINETTGFLDINKTSFSDKVYTIVLLVNNNNVVIKLSLS